MSEVRAEGLTQEHVTTNKEPSEKAWKAVLGSLNEGNNIFPQATFAQGILAARVYSQEAKNEGLDLSVFLQHNPPEDMALTSLIRGKKGAHQRYRIETKMPVWDSVDRIHRQALQGGIDNGRRLLGAAGKAAYKSRQGGLSDDTSIDDARILSLVQDDPVFLGILDSAVDGLREPDVTAFATEYREGIANFMHTYPPSNRESTDWDVYQTARSQLGFLMRGKVHSAASTVQKHLAIWAMKQYPDMSELRRQLTTADPFDFFPHPAIAVPNPHRIVELKPITK
jgi:hypothetical protein